MVKKRLVSENDNPESDDLERQPLAMIAKSTCNWEMDKPGNKSAIVHVF